MVNGLLSCALLEGEAVRSLICGFWGGNPNGVLWIYNDWYVAYGLRMI